jgi:2-polyprenyl-3-methyl-5-hydroxy-6-metoxy-1,4-benzoquinol methylase
MEDSKKKNIEQFNKDVSSSGQYLYHNEQLSSFLSNKRQIEAIKSIYNFSGKKIIDIGCGDGFFTLQLAKLNVKSILGVDPASEAIDVCKKQAKIQNLEGISSFINSDVYNLSIDEHFDCAIFCGVLHHLPDPRLAISSISPFVDNILILEPNGTNLVLKIIEKTSKYHIAHDEKSYLPSTAKQWLLNAGFKCDKCNFINLVPLFFPNILAKMCKFIEPAVESIPLIRNLTCGQYVILASK